MTTLACRACIIAALSAPFIGCVNVKTIHGDDADVVTINNEGYFLFKCIPLASGDPDSPNMNRFIMFSDTLKVKTNMRLLAKETERMGAKDVSDIVTFTTEESVIPILFSRETFQTSARLVW